MNQYYNRYQNFISDGENKIVPGIEIPIKPTDKYFVYKKKNIVSIKSLKNIMVVPYLVG